MTYGQRVLILVVCWVIAFIELLLLGLRLKTSILWLLCVAQEAGYFASQ